ncbi:Nucleoporin NUP53 [Blattella germanica]|nr:Nucleoporin NUP53 [Blattella germanica]
MEPMTLGSPVGSPAIPSSPGVPSPYLPEFLMGESTPVSGVQNIATSPGKSSKHVSFGSLPVSVRNASEGSMDPHITVGSQLLIGTPHAVVGKSSTGPPTKSLFDTLSSPAQFHTPTNTSFQHSPAEALFREVAWTEVDDAQNTWTTVFGFPPSAASFILSQFSHYGNILEKRMPAKGNWMHIRYQTKLECRKALSNNGKVFGGTIMIGVMPCKDQEILNDIRNKENVPYRRMSVIESTSGTPNTSNTSATGFGTPSRYSTSTFPESSSRRLSNVRPLGQAYRMAQADSEVRKDNNNYLPVRCISEGICYLYCLYQSN